MRRFLDNFADIVGALVILLWLLLLIILTVSCRADRFYVEGTHGWGEIEPGFKDGSFDTTGDAVTVGVSFALDRPEPNLLHVCPQPPPVRHEPDQREPKQAPAPAPSPAAAEAGGDLPWVELGTGILGMVLLYGGQQGHKHYRAKRARKGA